MWWSQRLEDSDENTGVPWEREQSEDRGKNVFNNIMDLDDKPESFRRNRILTKGNHKS